MWPIYLIGLSWLIPNNPITAYLTLQLRAEGFNTFETNLLTIPAYVLFIIQLLFWTWLSEKINQRFLIGLVSQIWALPLLVALELIPSATSHWVKYALSVLLFGSPYVHAILVAITSRNAGTVRTRTVASALYNMCVQASSIIGTNVSKILLVQHRLIALTPLRRYTEHRMRQCTGWEIKFSLVFVYTISRFSLEPSCSTCVSTRREQKSGMRCRRSRGSITSPRLRIRETRGWISGSLIDLTYLPGEDVHVESRYK